MLGRGTDPQTVNNYISGGVGGLGGEGRDQGTGGHGGIGQGPILHCDIKMEGFTVVNLYARSAMVLPKQLFLLGVSLALIGIFGGVIAHASTYFDLVSLSTSSQGQISSLPVPQVNQSINNCPPPSRIFHGRRRILDKMHKYFNWNQGQQRIFLLYGLGGAGKTQIALKFIKTSSCFSDIFLIDASTLDTIDAGLKNIAINKGGSTSQDALNWLRGKHNQWLLLFDNADDPEINLNAFFPQCDHGNIIVTSRNPGLRVYAGSDAHVSDMEETDAVKLMLISAAQEVTPFNEEMAAKIVQELSCLPLAIIQAGAFIAESGALNTYLGLFKQNQAQLLSKKPAQSHDDYGGTVYTTWQISFDRLSELAKTLLQLCSFLHHQGISEKIFSKASAYELQGNGPSEEELQKPMEFLSQYLGRTGSWDSLKFTEVTNQLRAYSLIDFNTESGLFSIHPLVHSWSQSTLTDPEMYHYSMVAIVGMTITTISYEDMQLTLQLVPHIDSLRKGQTHIIPDFNAQYGSIYYYSARPREAAELEAVVMEKQRATFGADHPETLRSMTNLAIIYHGLGRLAEAEELGVAVLEKRREILGDDHPDTLHCMAILAVTYLGLGCLCQAEELGVAVLEKQRENLGEDHPNTLISMANLAWTYHRLGRMGEAEELGIAVLEKRIETLGADHLDTLISMANLAVTYGQLGQLNQAEELEIFVLEKRKEILGEDHPSTLSAMANLAVTYGKLGQLNQAEKLHVLTFEKHREILGEDHPQTLLNIKWLRLAYQAQGKLDEEQSLRVLIEKIEGSDS